MLIHIFSSHFYSDSVLCGNFVQGAAANPENEDQQQRLREAAEGLRVATNAAAQNAIKKKIVNRLEVGNHVVKVLSREWQCCKLSSRIQSLELDVPVCHNIVLRKLSNLYHRWGKVV